MPKKKIYTINSEEIFSFDYIGDDYMIMGSPEYIEDGQALAFLHNLAKTKNKT